LFVTGAEQTLNIDRGSFSALFCCAEVVCAPVGYFGPLLEPARREADRLITELRR
jgi:hypothetical protein